MNILSNIGLTICGFIFLLFIIMGYIKSKKIKSYESNLFKIMLITICLSSILEILFGILVASGFNNYTLLNILVRVYVFITMLWLNAFTVYLIIVPNKEFFEKNKIYKTISIIVLCLLTIGPFIFKNVTGKIPLLDSNNIIGSINAVYGHPTHFCAIPITIAIISLIFTSYKRIDKTVKLTFFSTILLLVVEIIVTLLVKTELNELTFCFCLVTIIVYVTSESINVKLINEIVESKAESEKALVGQNEFISSMSHDIRTPLGALIGIAEVLLHDNNLTIEKTKAELTTVKDASEKLSELLNNLIDISKINNDDIKVENTTIIINSFVDNIANKVRVMTNKKNTIFNYAVSERMPSAIEGDFEKITKAILLILKAISQKTENGSININYSGEVAGDVYNLNTKIECVNTKITQADLNISFNEYLEMYTDRINTIDSEKLGIIISKYLVEILKGNISITLDETGKTICNILIPVSLGRGE